MAIRTDIDAEGNAGLLVFVIGKDVDCLAHRIDFVRVGHHGEDQGRPQPSNPATTTSRVW